MNRVVLASCLAVLPVAAAWAAGADGSYSGLNEYVSGPTSRCSATGEISYTLHVSGSKATMVFKGTRPGSAGVQSLAGTVGGAGDIKISGEFATPRGPVRLDFAGKIADGVYTGEAWVPAAGCTHRTILKKS